MSSALAVRHTREDDTARRNAENSVQAKRYWPGRAPEWGEREGLEAEDRDVKEEVEPEEPEGSLAATRVAAPVVVRKVADPRLARLSTKKPDIEDDVAAPRIVSRRQARDVSDEESEESEDARSESGEDDEDLEARRAAVKARLQSKRNESEEILAGVEEEEEEEEESEYETDTDEEQVGRQLMRPVFVKKQDRDTIAEREAQEQAELDAMNKEKVKLEARKHETREILISTITAEAQAAKAAREGPKEIDDVDTDDERDANAEYDSWRIRELQRIRRTREEREQMEEAADERERIKNMTDDERRRWERENPKSLQQAPKKSWKFQQKYWHKGAFYQDVSDHPHSSGSKPDDIYFRDYSAPTGEDKLNREILPKVMQVKNFGRRGRTKYTHLVDQDTTSRDDYYSQEGIRKPNRRHAGTEQKFDKPKAFNT